MDSEDIDPHWTGTTAPSKHACHPHSCSQTQAQSPPDAWIAIGAHCCHLRLRWRRLLDDRFPILDQFASRTPERRNLHLSLRRGQIDILHVRPNYVSPRHMVVRDALFGKPLESGFRAEIPRDPPIVILGDLQKLSPQPLHLRRRKRIAVWPDTRSELCFRFYRTPVERLQTSYHIVRRRLRLALLTLPLLGTTTAGLRPMGLRFRREERYFLEQVAAASFRLALCVLCNCAGPRIPRSPRARYMRLTSSRTQRRAQSLSRRIPRPARARYMLLTPSRSQRRAQSPSRRILEHGAMS